MATTAQLLFADTAGDVVVLDAVVLGGGQLAPGTPVTLRLLPPESPLISELVRSRLAAWAATGEVVDVEFRRRSRITTAVVSDGRSAVSLDVRAPLVA
ncbi:MAG TPA: hypothetical protein VEA78_13290 [Acidimicrobiales bacterium]|nr:hypothetical protein [Acidimicrobiales bacterium]